MPIGGGTFTDQNKTIPGVYANFSNVLNGEITPVRGVVAFLIPTTKATPTEVAEITLQNYRTALTPFADETKFYKADDLIKYCREILYNASKIYAIPIKATDPTTVQATYTFDEKSITTLEFNVLLHHDTKDDGFIITDITKFLDTCITSTNKRFTVVIDGDSDNIGSKITKHKKWYVYSYKPESSFYISGLLSGVDVGVSVSGDQYAGSLDTKDWIPKTTAEQEKALSDGRFVYYSIGNTIRVLKDITYQASVEKPPYNDTIGQIVRFEKYIYDWFSTLYANQMQGYPNTKDTRQAIKGVIVNYFMNLEAGNVLQNVQSTDVEVDQGNEKDAIVIKIRYHPVSGINYIYITFEVD